jgi:hypothetical protein
MVPLSGDAAHLVANPSHLFQPSSKHCLVPGMQDLNLGLDTGYPARGFFTVFLGISRQMTEQFGSSGNACD